MKILWFTNTPANAVNYLKDEIVVGGWMSSLDSALQQKDNTELHIAFYYGKNINSFKYGNTHYYPIKSSFQNKSKIQKYLHQLFSSKVIYEEDIKKYLRIIDEVKPDIIHIHGTENPFGLIAKYTNIPIVISLQGIITVYEHKYFSGISAKYLNKGISLKEKLLGKSYKHKYKNFQKFALREQEILNNADNIIGRTTWDKMVSKILAPNAKYFHNDELLRPEFYKKIWKLNKGNTTIQLFSIISPAYYKGLENIFQTANLLKNDINFEWSIAGLNENSLITRIVKQYTKLHPAKINVKFLGKQNARYIVNEMLRSDLYIHPSHIENSPNSVCEAMLLGIPIIANQAGGIPSLLENYNEGVLIQDGDPWYLAGTIKELWENYDKAVNFGKNARKRAIKRHNSEKIVNDLLNIYNQLVED